MLSFQVTMISGGIIRASRLVLAESDGVRNDAVVGNDINTGLDFELPMSAVAGIAIVDCRRTAELAGQAPLGFTQQARNNEPNPSGSMNGSGQA